MHASFMLMLEAMSNLSGIYTMGDIDRMYVLRIALHSGHYTASMVFEKIDAKRREVIAKSLDNVSFRVDDAGLIYLTFGAVKCEGRVVNGSDGEPHFLSLTFHARGEKFDSGFTKIDPETLAAYENSLRYTASKGGPPGPDSIP